MLKRVPHLDIRVPVILNQYLGRSRKRSIVFVGAGVLLALYFLETEHTRLSLDLASTHFPAQRELDAQISRLGVSIAKAEVTLPRPDLDDSVIVALLSVSVEDPSRGALIAPRALFGKWPDISPSLPAKLYRPRENDLKRVAESELGFPTDPAAGRVDFGAETRLTITKHTPRDNWTVR